VLHKVEGQENWNNMPIYANSPGLSRSLLDSASDISRGRGAVKFRYIREIPRNSVKILSNTCLLMLVAIGIAWYTSLNKY